MLQLPRRFVLCPTCHTRRSLRGPCRVCRRSRRTSAGTWIELLADRGSFAPLEPIGGADPLHFVGRTPYREQLARARAETGTGDSVLAGPARIRDRETVLIAFDFRFLGGSLGVAAGETIVRALELAIAEERPVVMIVASSGARMQEGLASLFQMARTAAAVVRLRQAGLPLVAVLADPTTGAPYASCAGLADIVIAERGALIGFAGPRVVAAVTGRAQAGRRAEELLAAGVVDTVAARTDLRAELASLLPLLHPSTPPPKPRQPPDLAATAAPASRWSLLEALREPSWPTGRRWLELLAERTFLLRGDRTGVDDPAIVTALAEIDRVAVLVLANDRLAGDGLIGPAGYRKVLRALEIAARLRLPVVSIVDTPGAAMGPEADSAGIAHWIAECFAALLEHPAPVVAFVVGQGSSGGALALSTADRIYMLERSVFSVIAPEGAAAILARSGLGPPEWAERLQLSAADALRLGLVDGVVPCGPLDRRDRAGVTKRLRGLAVSTIDEFGAGAADALVEARLDRYAAASRHLLAAGA